jgi:elongation factor 1-gamma
MSLANSDLLPAAGGFILPLIGKQLDVRKDQTDCLVAFYKDCRLVDNHLQRSKYLIGAQVTLADFFMTGMLIFPFMILHKVLHSAYPHLTKWFNEVYETPMFKEVAGELRLLNVPFPTLPEQKVYLN